MQTFLPYEDFMDSAEALDYKRLGKQRSEGLQILDAVLFNKGWIHHPASKMWARKPGALCDYIIAMCVEWRSRGYEDTVQGQIERAVLTHGLNLDEDRPWWVGKEAFHRSHRSNLLRKFPEHYRDYWPTEPDDLEYLWPSATDYGLFVISKPGQKRIAAGELRDPREEV